MYCPHCGSELKNGFRFCPNCGNAKIVDAIPVRTQVIYDAIYIAKQIQHREIAVNNIWIVIGVVQLCFGVSAIEVYPVLWTILIFRVF